MERAAKLLGKSKLGASYLSPEALAQSGWRAAVGARVAAYTEPGALVAGRLFVQVADDVWRRQLTSLLPQILANIAGVIGPGIVSGIELRALPRRRGPAQETAPVRRSEAEGIEDPVLGRIYSAARKRAARTRQSA